MAPRGFTLVDDQAPIEQAPQAQNPGVQGVATQMLLMGLGALSQRFTVALASLFTLLTVGSVFILWYLTPDPTQTQIVSLTLYALFILAVNYLNRRK